MTYELKDLIKTGEKEKEPKKIEFVELLTEDKEFETAGCKADGYANVLLIEKNYCNGYDLMYASDNDCLAGCLYLGYWNDGVQ